MIKASLLTLGLAALVALPAALPAQENPTDMAVNEAVLRQANTIVLRQKLAAARADEQQGDTANAAKLYQEACELVQKIGSGVDAEASQAVQGLANTRLALARSYQSQGNLRAANEQVLQVLKVSPQYPDAVAFKKKNDAMLAGMQGKMPSEATLEQVPQITKQKTDAATLVQNGKLLYEMGKLDEAETQLTEAIKLDPGNRAAYYYLNLIQQSKYSRENAQHTVDTQQRMADVEKQWVLPTSKVNLAEGNPYATNTLVYTGPGRQAIMTKLDKIHLDHVSYMSLPLSEVLRNLSEQSKLRDPSHQGINFLINPNPDKSGPPVAAPIGGYLGVGIGAGGAGAAGGFGGAGGAGAVPGAVPGMGAATTIDPATGLPVVNQNAAQQNEEPVDVGGFLVKIPSLDDVRLADVLDAICLVCDHPIKYSVQDFAVVFSAKGPETPQLFSRTFKVDPNTFYSGLESVSAQSFGSTDNGSSGNGSSGGGNSGGGGGNNSGNGNNNNSGAVVGVVNAFSGAGSLRNSGNNGGGGNGGGGGGNENGSGSLLNGLGGGGGAGGGGGGNNVNGGGGGLSFITRQTFAATPSELVRAFFTSLGVNLAQPAGKSVFFNDRLGLLFVKATADDLDTIERAIEALNRVAPQVHIKSRFVEVNQDDNKALGFDWYLGQFNINGSGSVVGEGGTAPSLNGPSGPFPGNDFSASGGANTTVPISTTDGLITSGLRNSGTTVGTITGILTNPQFRMVIHALEQRSGAEFLAEPEVTTMSGRQTQMRATSIQTVITGYDFQQGSAPQTSGNTTTGNQ